MTKIIIKSQKITPFGGIFHVMEKFDRYICPIINGGGFGAHGHQGRPHGRLPCRDMTKKQRLIPYGWAAVNSYSCIMKGYPTFIVNQVVMQSAA